MLDFLKITDVSELVKKFNVSWMTTAGLTVITPQLEMFLPLLIQVAFLLCSQVIAFGVDFMRLRYLNQKTQSKVLKDASSIEIETKFEENEKK